MIPQVYNVASQPVIEPYPWKEYGTEAMEWQQDGSDKLASISSPSTSYIHSDAPSGVVPGTTGGFVMVKYPSSGAYSNGSGSNQTSEEASEQDQQAYYSPPWEVGAELLVDQEAMHEFQLPARAHDQQSFLPDLAVQSKTAFSIDDHELTETGPEPQCNLYQQQAASGSTMYQEFTGNYTLHRAYPTSATESSPPHAKPQNRFSPPWNPNELRVPRFRPGFVAFGLSPEPEVLEVPRKSRSHTKKPSSRPSKLAPEPGRKDKAVSPGWEHIVVRNGGWKIVSELHSEEGGHLNGGRRKGKLEKAAADKAARVRKLKACWPCWLSKAPVSAAISKTFWCGPIPRILPSSA